MTNFDAIKKIQEFLDKSSHHKWDQIQAAIDQLSKSLTTKTDDRLCFKTIQWNDGVIDVEYAYTPFKMGTQDDPTQHEDWEIVNVYKWEEGSLIKITELFNEDDHLKMIAQL
jgi:hypothetical protein